ncbi:hypothetical protein J2Z76_000458 [Sedimentibacter acidaminivorans]|uniref:Uncharacterized protein n=1 Tax=Sedimentibacter acidaminivorans TaxID=913099 RepID=A0ABS4GA88_9FIRM|nr:hypothetical protein [Sedimentibacter acidaminivorans]MBP1924605.1 hypothetical protein [Sedimentibacter acidaminivorans]
MDRVSHGVYDLPLSIQSYLNYIKEQSKTGEELSKVTEEILLIRARRQKAEMDLDIIKGNVHRSEDVEAIMNDMLASFRAQLLVLPNKVAPLIIAQTEVELIKTIIKKYVNEALQELSCYDPDMFYSKSKNKITDENEDMKVAEDKEPPDDKKHKRNRKQD